MIESHGKRLMMMSRSIDGELHLALLQEKDAAELFRLTDANRAHLRQWLPWLDGNRALSDTESFLRLSLKQYAANNGGQFGIRCSGRLVGTIGFHSVDWSNQKTSIGYWLDHGAEGRGIMTRSCREMVNVALREWGLNRVEIRAAVGNEKSRAIPERLGFREEGIIREAEWLYDHYVDHVVYGMLARDWA